MVTILESLKWRYAVKRMNGQKVPDEKLEIILEAIRLAPTSLGLQAFSVVLVSDPELRAKIAPAIENQPQVTEGSHVLIFAAWTDFSSENLEKHMELIAKTRGADPEWLKWRSKKIANSLAAKSPEQLLNWTMRQTYIALGVGLVAAASEKVDATPMEGFDPDALDQLLGLREKGLRSSVIMTLGYRDSDKDTLSNAPKVRKPKEELVIRL